MLPISEWIVILNAEKTKKISTWLLIACCSVVYEMPTLTKITWHSEDFQFSRKRANFIHGRTDFEIAWPSRLFAGQCAGVASPLALVAKSSAGFAARHPRARTIRSHRPH